MGMPPIDTTARRLAEAYLTHVVHARRASPGTVRLYGFWLKRFLTYLGKHRLGLLPERPAALGDFLRWLNQERRDKARKLALEGDGKLSSAALRKAYGVVGTFYRWAADNGHVEKNPFRFMRPPLLQRKRRAFTTREACDAFLELVPLVQRPRAAHGPQLAARDQALFAAVFYAALRLKEACRLRLEDVELEAGFIIVRDAKGGTWRDVPLRPELAGFLKNWLKARRALCLEAGVQSPYVFIGLPGRGRRKDASPAPIDIHRVAKVLKKLYLPEARRRGLAFPDRFTPHSFRHSGATWFRSRGMEIDELKDLLGHRSIETTMIYDHVHPEQIRRAVLRA